LVVCASVWDGFERLARFISGVWHAIRGRVGGREVFRRGGGMAVNAVTLNALYKALAFGRGVFFQKRDVYPYNV